MALMTPQEYIDSLRNISERFMSISVLKCESNSSQSLAISLDSP